MRKGREFKKRKKINIRKSRGRMIEKMIEKEREENCGGKEKKGGKEKSDENQRTRRAEEIRRAGQKKTGEKNKGSGKKSDSVMKSVSRHYFTHTDLIPPR